MAPGKPRERQTSRAPRRDGVERWYLATPQWESLPTETLTVVSALWETLYNGLPKEEEAFYQVGHVDTLMVNGEKVEATGPIGPFKYIETIEDSTVIRFIGVSFSFDGESVALWYQEPTAGTELMRPGLEFKVDKGSTPLSKLNFVSLMVALFLRHLGFATRAHPLLHGAKPKGCPQIHYYWRSPPSDSSMCSPVYRIWRDGEGVIDVQNSNMSAPLLAKSFGVLLFAVISAIAFATVLGTVSGLIVRCFRCSCARYVKTYSANVISPTNSVW